MSTAAVLASSSPLQVKERQVREEEEEEQDEEEEEEEHWQQDWQLGQSSTPMCSAFLINGTT